MSNSPMIRAAVPADAAAVEGLYRELVGNPRVAVLPGRLAEIAADPHNFLLVAETDGRVVGTVFFTFCLDAMFGRAPFVVVEAIVVAAAARGQGVGAALIGRVEAEALRAGATRLMLQSRASRSAAHTFFARLGFDGELKRGLVKYLPVKARQGESP
jgi:predicted N-acetyltransferase YhbS